MEDNNLRLLGCQRKIRSFRANFEKMLAIVQYNKIQVMMAGNFRIIDVLEGHSAGIRCIDVSQITKAIASFSPGLLIVHAPFQGEGGDNVVQLGTLKWKESWRFQMKLMVRNLSLSNIGDFIAMSGDGFMTVWVRDSPVDFCYSQFIYHSKEETKGEMARFIKQDPSLKFFIQQEASSDGRLIIFLEEKSTQLRILYQDKYQRPQQQVNQSNQNNSSGYFQQSRNPYGLYFKDGKDDRIELKLESNPYADILFRDENGNGGGFSNQQGELKYQMDELAEYKLPKHQYPIEYFKLLNHDIFESEKRNLPNVFITVTSKNDVFLWQENLLSSELQFTCVHAFRGYTINTFFDAAFLEFPPINPKRYVELKANISKIFDTSRDKILELKKEENSQFTIYKENYIETSQDWVLVLTDQLVEIHKVMGLRNFPQRPIKVTIFNRYKLNQNPRDFYGVCKIIQASCRDFNDILSLYSLNTGGQLIKLRKDMREEGKGYWKIDKVAILKREYIQDVMVHKQLPVLAHLMNNTEIFFYIEEKTKNRIVQESLTGGSMRFMGAYSVFQSSVKHQDQEKVLKSQDHLKIVRAKWVTSPLCQMIVQFTNDTLALISSQTQLRILSHHTQREEYMKLWDSSDNSRNVMIAEQWVELQQVHFNQGHHHKPQEIDEHIVDFEVIKSKIFADQGSFQINLAIFTSYNQYLVYETIVQMQAGLKTISTTKLLYHVYTQDCVKELLSTMHYLPQEATDHHHNHEIHEHTGKAQARTVLAILSEVDPTRQRKELAVKKQKEAEEAALIKASQIAQQKQESDNDDDSEDGDIFAQFTGGSKKKKIEQPKKQDQVIPPPQKLEEKPLQSCLMIKLVEFGVDTESKKEFQEIWKLELPLDFRKKLMKCIASQKFFAFILNEKIPGQNEEQVIVYIYDISATKYLGFINLTQSLSVPDLVKQPLDLIFSQGSQKGSLTIFTGDCLYLIAESARDGQPGKWSVIRKIQNVIGFDHLQQITSISIKESYLKKQVLVINKCVLSVQDKFILKDQQHQKAKNESQAGKIIIKQPLHQLYTLSQKSYSIFDPKVLKTLFVKGYVNMVVKILVRLMNTLKNGNQVSEYLDLDIMNLMEDVQAHINEQNSASAAANKEAKKQETASSIFDDFYSGYNQAPAKEIVQNANQQAKIDSAKQLEQEFEESLPSLIEIIRDDGDKYLGLKDNDAKANFIEFLRRFKQIYKKEFFADNLTSMLLRDLYFDTEDIGAPEQFDAPREESQGEEMKKFNAAEYIQQLRQQPSALLKANIASVRQWNSLQVCLALHSEMQDVLINEIQERFDFDSNLNYDLMKKLCIPIWIKDIPKLKNLINIIAKNEYKSTGDDFGKGSRAEKTALWYIMIDKKDQLTRLYKQEPAFKKVYELLLNDFSLPKWKSTAEKNAMVLMSKKNYLLACAFFLLAGNLRDAIKIALDKLNDAVLAVLMARLIEKDVISAPQTFDFDDQPAQKTGIPQVKQLNEVYLEHFIKRGERLEDPYLQNIGFWQRKEYIKAINIFQIDPKKLRNIDFILNPSLSDFNIYYGSFLVQEKRKLDALELIKQQAQEMLQVFNPVPESSLYSYHTLDFIKSLKKSTLIKIALQQTSWNQPQYGAGKPSAGKIGGFGNRAGGFAFDQEDDDDDEEESIFDDFFAGGGGASKKNKKVVEEKNKEDSKKEDDGAASKLTVEESNILEVVCSKSSHTGYTLQALIIMAENTEHAMKVSDYCRELVAETIIWDFMNSPSFQYPSLSKLKKLAAFLVDLFKLDEQHIRRFILQQFVNLDNFTMQVNYMIEDIQHQGHKDEVLQCVEDWSLKIVDFVLSLADFPFVLIQDDKNIEAVPYIIRKAVSYLQQLAECFIIVEMLNHDNLPQSPVSKGVAKQVTMNIPNGQNNKEGNYEFSVEEEKGTVKLHNFNVGDAAKVKLNAQRIALTDDIEIEMQKAGAKTRIAVIIYLGLIEVCLASRKYMLLRDILSDLRVVFFNKHNEESPSSGTTQIAIMMQKLKTHIQKLSQSLETVENIELQQIPEEAKQKTKEQLDEEQIARKMNFFIEQWIQFCVSHHTVQLMRSAYDKTQIQSMIDQRPSIVINHSMSELVEMIINPRITSNDLLKRFVSLDRMHENVTTYYFENFLNINSRSFIANELQALQNNKFDPSAGKYLEVIKYFGSDRRFADFATYIDLGSYIKHLKDHELSLICHTYYDCLARAVEKTQQLYDNGIDIFRMKGEVVNAFAFDHCDMDLVSLALQGKGIREFSVRKSLLYRTRQQKGHQVVDEEMNNWHDGLHRFDRVVQEHADIKGQSDSIIAATERLYQYKTINYTKKQRRSRGTFLLDYELNPPDEWSGQVSNNFYKYKSDIEISHDDNTNFVESHPYLPLYTSGNTRGQICLWQFNQNDDRAIDYWQTDVGDPRQVEAKKATIKKITFNSYGDKIYCQNLEGNMFTFRFDAQEARGVPIYSLKRGKEDKLSDFDTICGDTVFAVTSQKQKHLWIYDTLLSGKGGLVLESQLGGNIMQPLRSKNQILLFNGDKPGTMTILDLKMNRQLGSIQTLHSEEISSVDINQAENSLVAGFKDGLIKIFNIASNFEVRETYTAFSQAGNKKGGVSQVRIHPTNGAVFAASNIGNLKLFRPRV